MKGPLFSVEGEEDSAERLLFPAWPYGFVPRGILGFFSGGMVKEYEYGEQLRGK
jgi:hypothetical protein